MSTRYRWFSTVLDPLRTPERLAVAPTNGGRAELAPSREERGRRLERSTMLGRFRILEQVGEGGMGRIYAAWDTRFDRKVALKVLTEVAENEAWRQRLEMEARILASIRHPNVVAFLDACEVGGDAFTVMEFLDGTTLRKLVRQAPLSHVTCVEVATQIVSGLTAIHDAGIVHRDLKPENVQVLPCGRVKILDLGLSIRLEPSGAAEKGRQRFAALEELSGTPAYIAPEQLRGGKADYRSDIFAFGVMLHEMLTGEPPIVARTLNGSVGSRLEETVRRCLRVRPEERYGSARELADALAAAAASSPNAYDVPLL